MNPIKVLASAKSLSNQWMPVNSTTHAVILAKLRKGHYGQDMGRLFRDLMGDLGLFGYCLRRLLTLAVEGKIPRPGLFDPASLFRSAGPEVLSEILSVRSGDISHHNLERVNEHQLSCMQQVLLSSAASEALAEKSKLPNGIGFTCAFLRQLGLTLIAWNYPHVLRHALAEVERGASLDETILVNLGYSPQALAITIARDWGIGDEILAAMGDTKALPVSTDERGKKISAAAGLIGKMCEVGEVLSQAALPHMYPEARGRWDEARQKMESVLGPTGMSVIEERFKTLVNNYLLANDTQISKLAVLPPILRGRSGKATPTAVPAVSTGNDRCPPELKKALLSLQKEIIPGKPNKQTILKLATEVLPIAGFSGVAIFTYDLDSQSLFPRFRHGECTLGKQRVLCSALSPTVHPAAEAFRGNHPVISLDPWNEEGTVGYVAQAFGTVQRVGVFYVEIGSVLVSASREEILYLFGLLKQTLQDCLSVK